MIPGIDVGWVWTNDAAAPAPAHKPWARPLALVPPPMGYTQQALRGLRVVLALIGF